MYWLLFFYSCLSQYVVIGSLFHPLAAVIWHNHYLPVFHVFHVASLLAFEYESVLFQKVYYKFHRLIAHISCLFDVANIVKKRTLYIFSAKYFLPVNQLLAKIFRESHRKYQDFLKLISCIGAGTYICTFTAITAGIFCMLICIVL